MMNNEYQYRQYSVAVTMSDKKAALPFIIRIWQAQARCEATTMREFNRPLYTTPKKTTWLHGADWSRVNR